MSDPYDLQRFVDAQASVYAQVRDELRAGRKRSHWMWFVFPQLRCLGHSSTAKHYGIASREEALAYLDHPLLGSRLVECTRLVTAVQGRSLDVIFGSPDDLKFGSSMTLFAAVAPDPRPFVDALAKYCDGTRDRMTVVMLGDA